MMWIRLAILIATIFGPMTFNIWIAKKLVWTEYDLAIAKDKYRPYVPTNGDWYTKVMEYGGPFNVFPAVNLIFSLALMCSYISTKSKYNELFRAHECWENKLLKR